MDSVQDKIKKTVLEAGEGKVYFPSDFFDYGSEKAVSKALQRLVDEEVLMRMERGIYCSPTESMWGMGKLSAGSDAVVDAIVRRDCIRIAPSAYEAQNILGLSEQVVVNPIYSTDGPSRHVNYCKNARPIVFYHVSPKVFSCKNRIVMLTMIALNDIGPGSLWEFDLDALCSIYKRIPYDEIREDLKLTPSWIRKLILQFYES